MKDVVDKLINTKQTISTMESCTGGAIANAITNVEGSSEVFKFSAVTYSNEFKIKMGVNSYIIDKYGVYSIEVAHEMAKSISEYTSSDYGIGVTGRINREDYANQGGSISTIYVSIYEKGNYHDVVLEAKNMTRNENKEYIIDSVVMKLKEIL